MQAYARRDQTRPAPRADSNTDGMSRSVTAVLGRQPQAIAQLQTLVNQSARSQRQQQLGVWLNQTPRVTAQARLAAALQTKSDSQRVDMAMLDPHVSGPEVVQRARVEGEAVADTQLVRINKETIFGGEDGPTVEAGEQVVVDDEQKYLSRRAPVYSAEDRYGEHEHRWFQVLEADFAKMPEGLYIPADRFQPELSAAADALIDELDGETDELSLELRQRMIAGLRSTNPLQIPRIGSGMIPELAGAMAALKRAFARDQDDPRAFAAALRVFVRAIASFNKRLEEPAKPTITDSQLDALYQGLTQRITTAKRAAESAGKPLLLLIAEGHYQASSELPKYMILDIIRRLKMSNVALEITPAEASLMAERVSKPPLEDLTGKGRFLYSWFHAVHAGAPPIATDVDKETVRGRLGSTVSAPAVEERNAGISTTMQELGEDALLIVGASHLQGLYNDARLQEAFYVKALSLVDPETVKTGDFFRQESGGELRETSQFLIELPPEIERLLVEGVEGMSPFGAADLARQAATRFHST